MAKARKEIWTFDVGTHTGLCRGVPGERPTLSSENFGKKDDMPCDIHGRAIVWTAELFGDSLPMFIYLEQPVPEFALKGKTQAASTEIKYGLFGVIAGIARAKGVAVRRAPISTVRKHFVGIGNLPSATAKARVFEVCTRLGWNPDNYDEADAGAVWAFAVNRYDARLAPNTMPLWLPKLGKA